MLERTVTVYDVKVLPTRRRIRRPPYFRVKRTRLGLAYERFLTATLPRGAQIIIAECDQRWPTTPSPE